MGPSGGGSDVARKCVGMADVDADPYPSRRSDTRFIHHQSIKSIVHLTPIILSTVRPSR